MTSLSDGSDSGIEPVPEPMFTFTTRSQKPHKVVECHHCGWRQEGDGRFLFQRADRHVCRRGPRKGLSPEAVTSP